MRRGLHGDGGGSVGERPFRGEATRAVPPTLGISAPFYVDEFGYVPIRLVAGV